MLKQRIQRYHETLDFLCTLVVVVVVVVVAVVIEHLYSALLWDEPITKALKYGP